MTVINKKKIIIAERVARPRPDRQFLSIPVRYVPYAVRTEGERKYCFLVRKTTVYYENLLVDFPSYRYEKKKKKVEDG